VNNWTGVSLLEAVEELAMHECMIYSEEELSERFDEMLDETDCCPEKLTPTDIGCMFADWTDGMEKDGLIHKEQSYRYCYVGRFDDD